MMAKRRACSWVNVLAACCLWGCATNSPREAVPAPHALAPTEGKISERYWRAGAAYSFPERLSYPTDTGVITTLHTPGAFETTGHPFFTPLGENGRACITCHQPADGMSLAARTAREVWDKLGPTDPLFAAGDGSNCPSLPQRERASHSLLLDRGLFRIARPWPPRDHEGRPVEPELDIELVSDPTGCNADPTFGMSSPAPAISVFRRPRPVANLKFATSMGFSFDPKDGLPLEIDRESGVPTSGNLLADDRERTLLGQARDALVTHTDHHGTLPSAELQRIIAFESQIYTAVSRHVQAGALDDGGATGGPDALARAPAGKLQSTKSNPIWGEFSAWAAAPSMGDADPQRAFRESVARGAAIFTGRQFLVSDSAGITDVGFGNPVRNSCAFCHNMLHVGMDVAPGQVDLGTTNLPHANPLPELPLFRLTCRPGARAHPHLGRVVLTHDPGYALTTGKCIDIGKITAQSLRGIAARPPYFVNGSAATLAEVVAFYDKRYEMKLSDQEKLDLQHLLEVL
jgi:hypothetical protein